MASDGTTAARLIVEVGAKGINETAAGLGRMDSAVRGTSQGIGGLVKGAVSLYAVKAGFDATIGAAIEWESAFAGVEKTVDASDKVLGELESTLLGMSRTMPVAATELAGIAEAAGALGIKTASIDEFTTTVAQLAETTNVASDQAATALGQLSNVLGLTEEDFDNFGAALVDLGNKGASTEADILAITSRAGAGAALIGLAADETLGWAAAVANLGIEAEAGGSSLQNFFLKATEHVGAAGAELQTLAETAGMSATEFARAFNEDASSALSAFIGGLGDLSQAQQLATLDMLGMSDIRITRTLLGLAGNVENLGEALDNSAEGWEENTALTTEYGKRADTAAAKIEVLGNRLGDLGRRVGEEAPGDLLLGIGDAVVGGLEDMFHDAEVAGENLANNFGGRFKNLLRLSQETGVELSEIGGMVAQTMVDEGLVFEEAFRQVRDRMNGIPPVMDEAARQTLAAWKQADLGGVIEEDSQKIDDVFRRGIGGLSEGMTEEMIDARKRAVEGMAAVMDAFNNSLRDGKDAYKQSWEDYLEGQKDPFTTAQRNAFIAGQFAGDEFDSGLHSDDPEHVANTVEYVNAQLAEFNLLNPGVLAIGREVPANLQAGMDEIMPELQAYVLEKTGETLDNLTLDEAKELGIDGILQYWLGMQSQEQAAADVASAIATRAVNELSINAYSGGADIIATWTAGMRDQWINGLPEVWGIANAVRSIFGGSLPTDGPLAGGLASGGISTAESWLDPFVATLGAGMAAIEGAAGGVGDALNGAVGDPAIGLSPAGAGGVQGTGGGETHIHFHLNVEGDLKASNPGEVMDAFGRMAFVTGFSDRSLVGG